VPKHAHGTVPLEAPTSSTRLILEAVSGLYDRIVDRTLLVRRINLTANHVVKEESVVRTSKYEQLSLFMDYEEKSKAEEVRAKELAKEKKVQQAMLDIKKKFGKNAVLRGMNFEEGATAKDRNAQIGGHKA